MVLVLLGTLDYDALAIVAARFLAGPVGRADEDVMSYGQCH
jgi:hypothetical protein